MLIRCDYCFAILELPDGEAPHGIGVPCPMKVETEAAYVAKLDAERMYYLRGGMNTERLADAMERIAPEDDE